METASRLRHVLPSATMAITAKARAMKQQGIDVVGFGAGEPDFDTPEHIKSAAIQALHDGFTKYTPTGGIDELKDAVIRRYREDYGLTYSRTEVIVSCGAKHTLYNIFQALIQEGDEVIIPSPCWVSYPPQVLLAGGKPVILPCTEENDFLLRLEDLSAAITPHTKILVLNSPSNPTGSVYSRKQLEAIAALIVKKNIFVISDEIYDKLVYTDMPYVSFASLGDEVKKRTVVVNGVSKTYAMTGWRIGYGMGDADLIKAISKIQDQSTSNPTSISQKASVAALNGPQEFIKVMREAFDQRRRYMVERLNAIPDISCRLPAGAFYVFPKVSAYFGKHYRDREIKGSVDLTNYLLDEAKVAVVPGEAFGSDAHLRLSFACSMENVNKGMERIAQALSELK